jgi:hypothetical protein
MPLDLTPPPDRDDTGPERFTLWPGPFVSPTSHPEGLTVRQAEQLTGISPAMLREEWWRRFGWAVRSRRPIAS